MEEIPRCLLLSSLSSFLIFYSAIHRGCLTSLNVIYGCCLVARFPNHGTLGGAQWKEGEGNQGS